MRRIWSCLVLAALSVAAPARADGPAPAKTRVRSFEVPYRLTVVKHILVRAKINGKGPFNFILDTGAPALFVSTAVCKRLGVQADRRGWGTFDRFEIEGGVVLARVRGRVETPFQLEGMNGMGLEGAELHGIIGYNLLARYRLEIDFTRDKMVWTPLDFEPKTPLGLGKGRGSAGGLEVVGSMMKAFGWLLNRKADPDVTPRGFLGIELEDGEESPVVKSVLATGPAGRAGVRAGDRLVKFQGRTVTDSADVQRFARKLTPGGRVKVTVVRGRETRDIVFRTGEGL
jgi:hypothetical protein